MALRFLRRKPKATPRSPSPEQKSATTRKSLSYSAPEPVSLDIPTQEGDGNDGELATEATDHKLEDHILSDEDEQFLDRLVSEASADAGGDPAPDVETGDGAAPVTDATKEHTAEEKAFQDKKRKSWFALPALPEGYSLGYPTWPTFKRQKSNEGLPMPVTTSQTSQKPSSPSHTKQPEAESASEAANETPARKEASAGTSTFVSLLTRLNLTRSTDTSIANADQPSTPAQATNPRPKPSTLSQLSSDTQTLISDFTQLLRDISAGAPLAYDDVDAFLRQRHAQIEGIYSSLPPFLQSFVRGLPDRLVASYAPEILGAAGAAAAAASSGGAKGASSTGKPAAKDPSKAAPKASNPTLRTLLAQRGAAAAALRSAIAFLEARFPLLVLGWANALVGMAALVVLLVFWYCWQRGREDRVTKDDETGDDVDAVRAQVEDAVRRMGVEGSDAQEEGKMPQEADVLDEDADIRPG